MASNRYEMFSIALVMVTLCGGAMLTTGCTIAIVSLSPCISYVTGNVSTPSQPCCAQLANVVQSEPLCFCALFSSGHTWTSSKVNKTLAKGLPKACNVTTTPLSHCNGIYVIFLQLRILFICCTMIAFLFFIFSS